jgi:cytochrome c oxidase subunit 2
MTADHTSTTRCFAAGLRTWLAIGALVACGALSTAEAQAGDAERGKAAYVVCQACHGANAEGNKDLNAPRLAGLAPAELTRQIENFKSGARGYDASDAAAAQMKPIVQTLASAQAIADVVAYIGTLQAPSPAATVAGNVAAGAAAYAICAACHGAAGEGNAALNAPKLAGQHDWYIAKQLQNFKAGLRGKGPGDPFGPTMAPMALTLADDAAVANVAAYIATLKE